jgi:hypothetical protein
MTSQDNFATIWQDIETKHRSLWSSRSFQPGEVVSNFYAGKYSPERMPGSIQIGDYQHILLMPELLHSITHSCNPNVFFDVKAMHLICIRPIRANEELCFFRPSVEWQVPQAFDCRCGSHNCLQHINGAANIPIEKLENYKLSDFIREKAMAKRQAKEILVSNVA